MLAPQVRLEQKTVAHRRGDEGAVSTCRDKAIEVPAAVDDPVILIVAAMQPQRRRFGGGTPFEDRRIDGLIGGAGASKPAAIEVDGAGELSRPHAGISNRQDAAARCAADDDAPEILRWAM